MSSKKETELFSMETLERLPDILTIVLASGLLIQEVIHRISGIDILIIQNKDWKEVVVSILVVALVITLLKRLKNIDNKFDKVIGNHLGIVEVLNPHENVNLVDLIMSNKAIKILTLSGSTTARLGDDNVKDMLKNNKKTSIQILLGNPYSDAIKNRYDSDEPDTCTGIGGISNKLIMLQRIKNSLTPAIAKKLDVRVFDNYPTISVLQADKDIYSSVYAYRLRGTDCPIVHAEKDTPYGDFLTKHYDGVCDASMPLEQWIIKYNVKI